MKSEHMIQSILDNDLYKFTMQQAVCRLYPDALVEYELTNRGGTPFPQGIARTVEKEINKMEGLALTREEKTWLEKKCPFFMPDYLDFLSNYAYDSKEVELIQKEHRFSVKIKGPWYRIILWEVPLMALISETYFAMTGPDILPREALCKKNRAKARQLAANGVSFVDFGTRRRFSAAIHQDLIRDILVLPHNSLTGTSNVHLARKFNITPVGTLAHEWIMFHSVLGNYQTADAMALDAWVDVYPDALGAALTDTYTTDVFLTAFNRGRALCFNGVRQDSGDPLEFTRKMIRHYRRVGIDPASKTIVFSDNLDPDRAVEIHNFCRGKIQDAYGIGTNLTNDVGAEPLNIVIKLCNCAPVPGMDLQPAVKLSDDPGKHTGDQAEILKCLEALGLTEKIGRKACGSNGF